MALPAFKALPNYKNYTGLGTVNLLTEDVVLRAAKEEIRCVVTVSLNWPLNFPEKPMFNRKTPEITQILKISKYPALRDDIIHMNSQSARLGIQNWARHGICGRGVLLDLVEYFTESGKPLPYDPFATHAITVQELEACAKTQGVTFRQGDILILRVGFIQKYNAIDNEGRAALGSREETSAGIDQSEEMKAFLCARWPPPENKLWGMPIGEFFDLEELSKVCKETGRYTIGGCASPANAAATF
ncbi:hypothetical protein BJ912DRAFT_1022801 [Pholiota molesta]|nr:hypothetical protein BJ912DRAFT_1022801 [Pholiota molesta]